MRRSVRLLRVFTDLDKFNRLVEFDLLAYKPYLVEFDFLAYKPYLLSLRNFLPESSNLRMEEKVGDPTTSP